MGEPAQLLHSTPHMALSRRTRWLVILGVVVVVVVIGRLIANPIVAKVIRDSVETMEGGYMGEIRDVEISVLGAEVAMLDFRITKTNGLVPVPFMDIPRFVLAVRFKNFRPYTELVGVGTQVHMVDAKSKAKQQWGPKFELRDLRDQLPFELSAVRFEDTSVHFHNYEARPQVHAAVRGLNAAWERLEWCLPPGSKSCDSELAGKAQVLRDSKLALRGSFDREKVPDFRATANLTGLKPTQLNPLLLEYAKLDAQEGSIDVDVIYRNRNDAQRLVLVPRLHGVRIMGSENKGAVAVWREMLAGIAAGYFERKRGTKAIVYENNGKKGEWRLIDWEPGQLSAR
ncbi:MAG TPA: DUF748 domain-containing protein [Polyangiales bacterium]|nr:DUF748 domain-containing protein [Polyangiales bacterium]